MSVIMREEPG